MNEMRSRVTKVGESAPGFPVPIVPNERPIVQEARMMDGGVAGIHVCCFLLIAYVLTPEGAKWQQSRTIPVVPRMRTRCRGCVDPHSESYFTSVKRIGGVGSLPISARGFVGVAVKEVVGLFDGNEPIENANFGGTPNDA
jgi:hypothetical protein